MEDAVSHSKGMLSRVSILQISDFINQHLHGANITKWSKNNATHTIEGIEQNVLVGDTDSRLCIIKQTSAPFKVGNEKFFLVDKQELGCRSIERKNKVEFEDGKLWVNDKEYNRPHNPSHSRSPSPHR